MAATTGKIQENSGPLAHWRSSTWVRLTMQAEKPTCHWRNWSSSWHFRCSLMRSCSGHPVKPRLDSSAIENGKHRASKIVHKSACGKSDHLSLIPGFHHGEKLFSDGYIANAHLYTQDTETQNMCILKKKKKGTCGGACPWPQHLGCRSRRTTGFEARLVYREFQACQAYMVRPGL